MPKKSEQGKRNQAMSRQQVSGFEKTQAQLNGFFDEISALSRKKPDSAINKFKLKLINQCLNACKDILGSQYLPFEDFDLFNEDDLPTNSDVVVVLSQYLGCLEKLRADNIYQSFGSWYWKIIEGEGEVKTAPPKKLLRK